MNKKQQEKKRGFNIRTAVIVAATTVATSIMAFTDVNTMLYKTSILSLPEHAPYNGLTNPVKKIPNWTHLESGKRDLPYSQLAESDLTDLPYYDPGQLQVSTDSLKWGNPVDDSIRNAKITYSVPYLGTYKLDGIEGAGSHPAIDIKVPEGTPVYAIGNGVVSKVSNQSSGFGEHIVVQHNNFPSFDDPNTKTVLYSSYSHLSATLVNVGDVVTKGQQIALSGETGTATTPHVHFQIDNDQAPWHPFWPFTWKEVADAGLDFFSAVNAGLGKESATATTINPMKYVQKYMDNSVTPTVTPEPPAETTPEVTPTATETNPVDAVSYVASTETPETTATTETTTPTDTATEVVTEVAPTTSTTTSTATSFSDVPADNKYYESITYLVEKNIIKGYDDGTFKPNQPVNRAEALKFILESISAAIETGTLPFTDVTKDAWYSGYLFTAYKREIVNGNPDGTFRPENTVNKAEFFKILFNGLSVDIDPVVTVAPYEDVATTAWFASYISYAKELGILDTQAKTINPSVGMTRGEVADAMWRLMKLVK
ncbi:MAG: S-layer homology domain-containing protein [Patescibacteria group bacterium]